MKKYFHLILIFLLSISDLHSQTTKQKKKLRVRADFRIDQVRLRVKNKLKVFNSDLNSLISIREKRLEYYEELQFRVDTFLVLRPAAGFEYSYSDQKIKPRVRMQVRIDFEKYFFLINYGSDIVRHGLSTRSMYRVKGNFLLGIQSSNEHVGPRVDWSFCALGNSTFKLGLYYLRHDDFGFALRCDLLEFFPSLKEKLKKIEKGVNRKFNPFNRAPKHL